MTSRLPAPTTAFRPDDRPLFVYGTLVDREFVENLLERPIRAVDAVLVGWRVVAREDVPWPTVVPAPRERSAGRILLGLRAEDWTRLDAYEGVGEGLYERILAAVEIAGETQSAWVYRASDRAAMRYGAPR